MSAIEHERPSYTGAPVPPAPYASPPGVASGPQAPWGWAAAPAPPPPYPPARSPAPRRRRYWIIGAICAAAVALQLAGVVLAVRALATPAPVDVRGQLSLSTTGYLGQGASCQGSGGYSDITPGQAVMLRDASGRLLAATHLADGRWSSSGTYSGVCVFQFEFAGVVLDEDPTALYTVAVGTGDRRGEVPFTRDELLAGASLTLGS